MENSNKELQRFNFLTIKKGIEDGETKKEIAELKKQLGQEQKIKKQYINLWTVFYINTPYL